MADHLLNAEKKLDVSGAFVQGLFKGVNAIDLNDTTFSVYGSDDVKYAHAVVQLMADQGRSEEMNDEDGSGTRSSGEDEQEGHMRDEVDEGNKPESKKRDMEGGEKVEKAAENENPQEQGHILDKAEEIDGEAVIHGDTKKTSGDSMAIYSRCHFPLI